MQVDHREQAYSEIAPTNSGLAHKSSLNNILFLTLLSVSIFCFSLPQARALNEAAQTYTVDGKLYQVGGSAYLIDTAAKLTIQIIDPTGKCLLYEEQQTVNTSASGGYFNIHVGSATGSTKRTVNDPGRTMNQIFQNMTGIVANNVSGQTCAGGVYTPAVGAVRYFRITVTPSATGIADTLTPDIVIDSVPTALVSQSVQGLERANILQVNNSGSTVLTQSNLEALFTTPAYANLQSILAGNFMPIDSSGATLPSYAANPAGVANGDIWFDTVTNEIKYKNAAGVQVVGTSGGGITSLTVGSSMSVNGSVAGTISGSGTIDLSNTGVTAGTYTKMTVDEKGRVTAGTISLVEGDIPSLTVAGKVSGNTITSGTISGSTAINTSGNLVTTGTISGLTVQATNVRVYNGANYLQMTASTMSGNVNLTLPATTGSAGEFLSTDGNGILSWSGITSLLAGDVSGAFGSTSVDKIKGKAITAATVSGQMMIYDGTAWTNNVMSGDATLAHNGIFTLNKVPVAKGGTNATTFGNNKIISSNGTGSTLQDFSCSLNQVITFDASGYAVCSNVSSLFAGILNGGNTTGADISVGTNDNKALQFKTNNTVAMTISQGGNVGIGTAAPALALHIFKDASALPSGDGIQIETITSSTLWYGPTIVGKNTHTNGTTGDQGILLGLSGYSASSGNGSGHAAKITLLSDGNPGFFNFPGRIDLSTTPNGGNNPELRMTIRQDGNVGIGIDAPATALHISGAFTAQAMSSAPSVSAVNTGRIYYDYSTNKFKVSQNGGAYADLVGTSGAIVNGGNTTAGTISIGTNDNHALQFKTNNTTAMTISQSGNIGIGTATPLNKLQVNVTALADGVKVVGADGPLNSVSNGTYVLDFGLATTNGYFSSIANPGDGVIRTKDAPLNGHLIMTTQNATGKILFATGSSPTTDTIKMAITNAGNVGIGISTPTAKLEVQGQLVSKVHNNGAATTFDFANGNSQYTSASCGAMILQNMVDGGSYTIAVQGATAGTCTFTDSAGGRTFKFAPTNAATTAATHSIYSMQVMGSFVYVAWITGL